MEILNVVVITIIKKVTNNQTNKSEVEVKCMVKENLNFRL